MTPIDTGIYGAAIQPVQPIDPMRSLAQIAALKGAQQNQEIQRLNIQDLHEQRAAGLAKAQQDAEAAARKRAEDQTILGIYHDAAAAGKAPTAAEFYQRGVDPARAHTLLQGQEALTELANKNTANLNTRIVQAFNGVLAAPPELQQHAYTDGRNSAIALGAKPEDIPEQFSPGWVQSKLASVLTAKEALERTDPKLQSAAPGSVFIDPRHPEAGPVYTAPKELTYGAPDTQLVNGKPTIVRPGSDGRMYGLDLKPIEAGQIAPIPPKTTERLTYGAPEFLKVNGQTVPVRAGSDGQLYGPDLKPIAPGAVAPADKPRIATGEEQKALGFYVSAKEAVDTLMQQPDAGTDSLEQRIAKSGVVGQSGMKYLPNALQSNDQQAYLQAQRAFTEARLRKVSGSAINKDEYAKDALTYFAQPGDSQATILQKQKARQTALDGMKFSSGKAYEEYYGHPINQPEGKIRARDPQGNLHEAEPGTALPAGWTLEK